MSHQSNSSAATLPPLFPNFFLSVRLPTILLIYALYFASGIQPLPWPASSVSFFLVVWLSYPFRLLQSERGSLLVAIPATSIVFDSTFGTPFSSA